MAALDRLDSTAPFKRYALCWQLLGVDVNGSKYCFGLWELLLTLGITITYPLHLIMGLLYSESKKEIFANLVVNVAICACSLKVITYRLRLPQMQRAQKIMQELDRSLRTEEERKYLQHHLLPSAFRIVNSFFALYSSTFLMSVIALVMSGEKRLLYPGWFPYNWRSTYFSYGVTAFYQCFGLGVEAVQSLANDVFGPLSLCIFAGHVHMLKIRLSNIGHSSAMTSEQNNQDLIACIEDYFRLMSIYKVIQNTLSAAIFMQFLSGGLSIGVAVIYILFYMDDYFTLLYNVLQLLVFFGELFPCCYYGSLMELEFRELPYAIFSCNWIKQDHKFRRIAMIFSELTLRSITIFAGGMIRINIRSFFSTCKVAYSFFTLLLTLK